jgi:hypothetical protein
MLNLKNAVILTCGELTKLENKAVSVLAEEIEKRTGIMPPVNKGECPAERPFIAVIGSGGEPCDCITRKIPGITALQTPGEEGFRMASGRDGIAIWGADQRGTYYGAGMFLRKMIWGEGKLDFAADFEMTSTPEFALRGHQLGYRPKTNAYDAWLPETYDQYIRELEFFGANSIEIMPPRTDDDATGPLMKVDPLEMMAICSEIIDSYGMDVWIWYPNMGKDYSDPDTIAFELAERDEVFSKLSRIDHVFVPGGDPGNLESNELFNWMDQVYPVLHKYHPNATIWLAPQAFKPSEKWVEDFYKRVDEEPEWLGGIVFGPWEKDPLPVLRARIPDKYPIRRYPDITHSLTCQYPIYNWDLAFGLTLGRECINPRPVAEKHVHNIIKAYSSGSLSYSEGINDDANKIIWSGQDWDSNTPVIDTLRDFARVFMGPELCEGVAQGLVALERNFDGPLAVNMNVSVTLKQWKEMEESHPDVAKNSYRFQQGLLRANFDAYIQRRLIHETELEMEAIEAIKEAGRIGPEAAMAKAEAILEKANSNPVGQELKTRCDELADSLFELIGAQLTTERHKAKSRHRGGFMDSVDTSLNNGAWILANFKQIRGLDSEKSMLTALLKIADRNNPGPGGFYDNLGDSSTWRRVDPGKGFWDDPGFFESAVIIHDPTFVYNENWHNSDRIKNAIGRADSNIPEFDAAPLSMVSNVKTYYGVPLKVKYENLADCDYRFKVVGFWGEGIKMIVNGNQLDWRECEVDGIARIYDFPASWINDGHLEIVWSSDKPEAGNCSLMEIWLSPEV